jgi:hypothetical protein
MRAADDFAAIRARMEELRRERLGRREPEQRTAACSRHQLIIGASNPKTVKEMKAGLMSETGSGWRRARVSVPRSAR